MVKQETARVNIDISGISELKWTGMDEFNLDDHYIYYCGRESLKRNRVVLIVDKRIQNAVLGCNLKNDRMISVRFQAKPFNITVIQAYAPTSNVEEADVEWFCEDLQDLLELTPQKDLLSIIGVWNANVGRQEIPGVTGKFGLGIRNEAKANRVLPRECTVHSKHSLPTTHHQMVNTEIRLIIFFAAKDGDALYSQQK